MGGFFQHAPSTKNLEYYTFHSEESKKKVATANLTCKTELKDGEYEIILIAGRDLEAKEQLTWDYDFNYLVDKKFYHNIDFSLFDQFGELIPRTDYSPPIFIAYSPKANVEGFIPVSIASIKEALKQAPQNNDLCHVANFKLNSMTANLLINRPDLSTTHINKENASSLTREQFNNITNSQKILAPLLPHLTLDKDYEHFNALAMNAYQKEDYKQAIGYWLQVLLFNIRAFGHEQNNHKNMDIFARNLATAYWKLAETEKKPDLCDIALAIIEYGKNFLSEADKNNPDHKINIREKEIASTLAQLKAEKAEVANSDDTSDQWNCSMM